MTEALFRILFADPATLPGHWAPAAGAAPTEVARTVTDYIAGMTDRFAMDEHRRLTDPYVSG